MSNNALVLMVALEESVKLQSHYANLLNMYDGGQRMIFKDAQAWLDRLTTTKTIAPLKESEK